MLALWDPTDHRFLILLNPHTGMVPVRNALGCSREVESEQDVSCANGIDSISSRNILVGASYEKPSWLPALYSFNE